MILIEGNFVVSNSNKMKSILSFLFVLTSLSSFGQTEIKGKIIDENGKPFFGANVFVKGTYDGTNSDADGNFSFTTSAKGNQQLQISFLSFETLIHDFVIEAYKPKVFTIKESINSLNVVEVTAGTFKAGDNSKATALKAMDIVTTAGSAGNIIAALETLPGTQTVGESGRLFVRGGEADETQTYVDGIRVGQPYGVSANNVPTRGRFSPFLFSGITFSTGGYSAEFGDALSSVLLLNTIDEPTQNQTDISIMSVGVGLGKTKKWEKSSFTFNTSYINLAPYQKIVPQNLDWNKPVQSISGESIFRYQFKNGILKVYGAFDYATFDLNQKDVNFDDKIRFDLQNNNFYFNTSYKGYLNEKLQLQTGFSYGYAQNRIGISGDKITNNERTLHAKFKLRNSFSNRFKLSVGADLFHTNFDENFNVFGYGYQNNSLAFYSEAEVLLSKKVAFNLGLRSSNASVVDEFTVEPRVSFAYKVADNSQFSLAYGSFNQTARQDYLKFDSNLDYETTSHYILNYMYNKDGRMFRAETYFKDYESLVKYDGIQANFNSNYNNKGFGSAKGLDLFWRDSKTIKNLEYWVSYSFIDSKRDFRNYESQVTPSFVANHNFSLVTKYFVSDWRSQISATYSFNSGRPYDNPNVTEFMSDKTKSFNNLSLSWAYLVSQQKILFLSVTNLLGTENVFGYQYADSPDGSGQFQRQAITQPANRFIFVGLFWTISDNKKTNNLENL